MNIGTLYLPNTSLFLAPMEGVTDQAFRLICKQHGADMMYTEFVSSEGLIRDAAKSTNKINILEQEKPMGIQIFGNNVTSMCQAASIAQKHNPSLIDINCGCPVRKVVSKGCGAALLLDLDKLVSIVEEVVKCVDVPVTVKTRLGWDDQSINIETLVLRLQEVGVSAVTIHARTRQQMYSGNARWEYLSKIKKNKNIKIPIIGNGDIRTIEDAKKMIKECRVDGIMIGRGAIGNPWIFENIKNNNKKSKTVNDICKTIKEHLELACNILGEKNGILSLRKHYSRYFYSISHSKDFRIKLQTLTSKKNITECLNNIIDNYDCKKDY